MSCSINALKIHPRCHKWQDFFLFWKYVYLLFLVVLHLHCCLQLSLAVASRGYSVSRFADFSLCWFLLLWATDSRAQAQQLWPRGSSALWHVESARTRGHICVPWIGKQILSHCTVVETSTRETKHHTGRVGELTFTTPAGPEQLTL